MEKELDLYSEIEAFDKENGFKASFPEGIINFIRKEFLGEQNFDIKVFEKFVKSTKMPEEALDKIFSAFFVYGFNEVLSVSLYGMYNDIYKIIIDDIHCVEFPYDIIRLNAKNALGRYGYFSIADNDWIMRCGNNKGIIQSRDLKTFRVIHSFEIIQNKTILHTVNVLILMGVSYAQKLLSHIKKIDDKVKLWDGVYSVFNALNSRYGKEVSKIELGNIYFVNMALHNSKPLPYLEFGPFPHKFLKTEEDD